MTDEAIALVLGTLLAVGALAYVLYPLFFDTAERAVPRPVASEETESAIRALREIEFDRATGKLSDADYQALRSRYAGQALAEMRAAAGDAERSEAPPPSGANQSLDDIEARVKAYRQARKECTTCGLRPEPDAIYCSSCGGYLDRSCPKCGSAVGESSAAFCSTCGTALGALAPV